jgi:predicted MPP superfamily phosphohydrolase
MKRKLYIIAAVAAFLAYSGLIEPYWINEKTYDISVAGLGARELTVVHIADIHTTRFGSRERQTVDLIERIKPDYVFVTGDLRKKKDTIHAGLDFMSRLRARHGVYLVPGNADGYIAWGVRQGKVPRETDTYRILMNESVDCGAFTLVGLDDPVTHREDVGRAFEGVPATKPVFVLTHFHPDSLLWEFETRKVDVVFSGHTHGGQTGLAVLVGLVPYAYRSRYISGLYKLNRFYLSVTRGVGTNIFPLRFLCRPEVVVLRIKRK